MFESLREGKDLEFVENLGLHHTTESNGRSATFEVWKRSVFLVGTDASTLVDVCHQHGTQDVFKNLKKWKQKTTLAKLALYASGFVVDTSSTNPSIFWNRVTTQHLHKTDLTGRLNVTTAVALANTQWPPARNVSSITPSHQLHTALIFDKQNCNSLLMYVGYLFFSVLKEKRNVWNFVEIQRCPFFALQTLTSLLYFFLLEKSLVIIYYHNDYDHLFTRCTRCPPACLCVHERSDDSMTEWRRMRWR